MACSGPSDSCELVHVLGEIYGPPFSILNLWKVKLHSFLFAGQTDIIAPDQIPKLQMKSQGSLFGRLFQVDALGRALRLFRGSVVIVSHNEENGRVVG